MKLWKNKYNFSYLNSMDYCHPFQKKYGALNVI